MRLYYSPGACSLADHIALHEAKLKFDLERVDLSTKVTESGRNYNELNPKSYVPMLEMDDGTHLTENIAILTWIARREPSLAPQGELADIRLLDVLAFISTEVHKQFGRLFRPTSDAEAQAARENLRQRLELMSKMMKGPYLFGAEASVADAYLYTMLAWANKLKVDVPQPLADFAQRMGDRPAVKLALQHEGLQ